ncbi:MAG: class I SAM-dependent methyltransferase [Hydrogenophilaceae bacterium]|nr:class I SAM-dependent methyltransferase [Hydrogenophilaceae bacterium]
MRDLPPIESLVHVSVVDGVRGGRVPREGYQRGWGLQFGGLSEKIEAEPLFRHAINSVGIPQLVSPENRKNIYLLLTRYLPKLPSQNIIEFGTYRGGNALFMALIMRELNPSAKVYALDTFTGMPETDKTRDAHSAGDFSDASLPVLNERIAQLGLTNLLPVQGLFEDTFPGLDAGPFGLAHIDCDIYSGVKFAQDAVWPRMCAGGYVVYDDATVSSCLGATEAVEELILERKIHSEQVWPHFVFRVGL